MIKTLFKVMALGAILTTTEAFAQDQPQQVQPHQKGARGGAQEMFNKMDTDKDGKLSVAEVENAKRGKLKENFTVIDTNKDNFLDKEELLAYRKAQKAKRLNRN